MAGPVVTAGAAGNLIASGSLAASGAANATIDFSTGGAFGGDVDLKITTGGTVAATNGCRLDIFAAGDSGPTFDTVAMATYSFSGLATSTVYQRGIRVPTGLYKVVITNLDATNAITAQVTSSKLS